MDIVSEVYSQEYVDQLLLQAEEKAEQCEDEQSALSLLQDLQHLNYLSRFFFVPQIVFSWEEMALSYVESDNVVFEVVYLPEMQKIYDRGMDALIDLEDFTVQEGLAEHILFNLVFSFNLDVREFNQSCKAHHAPSFKPYYIQNRELNKKYKDFMESCDNESR